MVASYRRRMVLLSTVICGVALGAASAAAQDFPVKPVRIVNAFPAGSPTDVVARVIAGKLAELWGQPVLVENRGGAGGNIGAQLVAKSAPDGYTILSTSNAIAVNVSLYRQPGFASSDFVPLIRTAISPSLLFVHPSVAATNLTELVALAKSQPLSYASSGTGTGSQLFMEWLKSQTGAAITHVPFTPATAVTGVVGNQAPIGITSLPAAINQVKSGKLRPILVTTGERSSSLPDVPTIVEAGHRGFVDAVWFGMFLPAGTPGALTSRVNADINRVLQMAETRDKLGGLGMDTPRNTQPEFEEEMRREVAKYAKIVSEIGAKAD